MNKDETLEPSDLPPLSANELRWKCDTDNLSFDSTDDLDTDAGIVGQATAREALEFGLLCLAPGQNVYVRGQRGTGRRQLVLEMLDKLKPECESLHDFCYVQNFDHPDRPRLITLPAGHGNDFRAAMNDFATFVEDELGKALDSDPYYSKRETIQQAARDNISKLTEPFEQELLADSMQMVNVGEGPAAQKLIVPVVEGQPVPPEQLRQQVAENKIDASVLDAFEARLPEHEKRIAEIRRQANEEITQAAIKIRDVNESAIRELTSPRIEQILKDYSSDNVKIFIDEIIDHLVEMLSHGPPDEQHAIDLKELYGVNVIHSHEKNAKRRPIIEECTPSLINLLGTVEPKWGPQGMSISDYRGIRTGSLLQADQGYLIMDVGDLLSEPGAWRALTRTLRTGNLEIVPPEVGFLSRQVITQPEAIQVSVRVILIGDVGTFYQLDQVDPDFAELFKVLADFDSELDRDDHGVMQYAQAIAQLAKSESLPAFDRSAVGALAEHGARIVARGEKLTARFGRIADIAREAAFLAKEGPVEGQHVEDAVRRTKARASLPSVKFQQMVESGTLLVQTSGFVVGQINGLAVMRSGPLTYGFPARITASIGPGNAGLIDIEGQAQMSGAIHTKGFHILGGLLRNLLKTKHPLCFSASLAFEQSYGGIDGDSASGAEIVCLLSALTGIPIKQEMAMTGAVDQRGRFQAIGGVNEKIEGFFDACQFFGLTGDQGVVIPASNAGDLMLRQDVVDAAKAGKFHVYAVDSIFDAIELMTGAEAGEIDSNGNYPVDSLLAIAQSRAGEFWKMTHSNPNAGWKA
jgi:ATP-dependent Lon protease